MVIKLDSPVRAGTTLGGGTRIYQCICGMDESQPNAVYLTKQFLSDWEAKHMLESIATPTDSIIVMARHLTKRTELGDLIRRAFKDSLEAILKFDVLVWVSTLRHKWAGDMISEETFLVAAVPAKAGGRIIGKSLPGLESDSSFFKLSFGSLELECFTDLKQVINKPWMTTFRPTETIEIGHEACGSSMGHPE